MAGIDEGRLIATLRPTGDIGRSKSRRNMGFSPAEVG